MPLPFPTESLRTLIDLFKSGQWKSQAATAFAAAVEIIRYAGSLVLKDGEAAPPLQMGLALTDAEGLDRMCSLLDECEGMAASGNTPEGTAAFKLPAGWQTVAFWLIERILKKVMAGG